MRMVTVGIDLAKNIFAVHGVDENGKAVLIRPKVTRDQLLPLIVQMPPHPPVALHRGRCGYPGMAASTPCPRPAPDYEFDQRVARGKKSLARIRSRSAGPLVPCRTGQRHESAFLDLQ